MKLEHIAMYVSDLERAKDFFVRFFQAQVAPLYHNPKTGLKSYFLSFEEGARMELMYRPEVSASAHTLTAHTGYVHVAFGVGGKESVDRLTEQLRHEGYAVVSGPRTTGDGCYESCIVDVEGNQIEITE